MRNLPTVAVVGAPNVGKSSFVNRVVGRRTSVVADEPGTTRDRAYNEAEWAGREFILVDTGGMEPTATVGGLQALVTLQAKVAVEEADVILHIVDSRLGPTEIDSAVARELRMSGKEVVLAVNKLDDPGNSNDRFQFYSLGEGEPYPLSSIHGLGTGDLLDEIVSRLPQREPEEEEIYPTVAIVGRPNAGKSTLLNRLIGADRAVVSEVAGTTTDSVRNEIDVDLDGQVQRFVLLDTAGVNRSARRAEGVPYYSSLRTSGAIRSADVSLLLIDAQDGVVGGDLRLAKEIAEAGRSCGVIVNKTDLVSRERLEEIEKEVSYRLTDLKPGFLAVSALHGRGVDDIMPFAAAIYRSYCLKLPTHEIAEFINKITDRSAPARGVKIRYATQTGTRPPAFTIFANRPKDLQDNYLRYIENNLRQEYDLYGVSLKIRTRSTR